MVTMNYMWKQKEMLCQWCWCRNLRVEEEEEKTVVREEMMQALCGMSAA